MVQKSANVTRPLVEQRNTEGLVKENESLHEQVNLLNARNLKLESIIKELENDKASLMTSLRLLRDETNGSEDKQRAHRRKEIKNGDRNKHRKSRSNRQSKENSQKIEQRNKVVEVDDEGDGNSREKKRVVILGDSTIKGLKWWKMSSNKKGPIVNARSFPGCTIEDMESYMLPTLRKDPDEIILHVGTNNLKHDSSPRRVAEQVVNLVDNITQNHSKAKVTISGLLSRSDDNILASKVPKVNKVIRSFATNRGWSFIDHANIEQNCLNKSGLHLNQQGSDKLSKNILSHIANTY